MLGDDDGEDLEAILGAVQAEQQDGGAGGWRGGGQLSPDLTRAGPSGLPMSVRRESFSYPSSDPNLLLLLARGQDMMEKLAANMMMGKQNEEVKRKRDEVNYQPQEPVTFREDAYDIKDDAHLVLDFKLRSKLRPINGDPKEWWTKGAFPQVARPILGALHMEHLIQGGGQRSHRVQGPRQVCLHRNQELHGEEPRGDRQGQEARLHHKRG